MNKWLVAALLIAVPVVLFPSLFEFLWLAGVGFVKGIQDQRRFEPAYLAERFSYGLEGQNCFVTGANRGLGRGIAAELLMQGCNVYLLYRSSNTQEIEQSIIEDAKKILQDKPLVGAVHSVHLDMSDLESVRGCAAKLAAMGVKFDVAVLNAAILPIATELTKQGFELAFGVNYLANYVFVKELLSHDLLVPSSDSRSETLLIILSSESHQTADPFNESKIGCIRNFGLTETLHVYSHTKLMLVTWGTHLKRSLGADPATQHIVVTMYDPGAVASDIARHAHPALVAIVDPLMKLAFKTPEQSSFPTVHMALHRDLYRHVYYTVFWSESPLRSDATTIENGLSLIRQTESLLLNGPGPECDNYN